MTDYETFHAIKHLRYNMGLNISQIAEELKLSRPTVRRQLKKERYVKAEVSVRPSKLDPYREKIKDYLKIHSYTAVQIFRISRTTVTTEAKGYSERMSRKCALRSTRLI